jgi:hypothetical protein
MLTEVDLANIRTRNGPPTYEDKERLLAEVGRLNVRVEKLEEGIEQAWFELSTLPGADALREKLSALVPRLNG